MITVNHMDSSASHSKKGACLDSYLESCIDWIACEDREHYDGENEQALKPSPPDQHVNQRMARRKFEIDP